MKAFINLFKMFGYSLRHYATFRGRASRREYLSFTLVTLLITLLVGGAVRVEQLIELALLLPSIALSVRRLHDLGKSGWLILLPGAALVVALIVALFFGTRIDKGISDPAGILIIVTLPVIISLGFTLWLALKRGEAGDNRFGQDPRPRDENYLGR